MENTKMNFFTRIKKAIFKFDEYEKFVTEPTKQAIGYFIKLIVIFSLVIAIALTFQINKQTKKTFEIINNEFPDFTIENNNLKLEGVDKFEHYFEEINLNVIMSEDDVNIQKIDYTNSLILSKNKVVLKYNGINQEILYKDVQAENISKDMITNVSKEKEWTLLCISVGLVAFLISFLMYFVIIFIDILTLTILGLIINLLIRTSFKFKEILKISIYSMTLPIILFLIYIDINILFGTTIKYFEFAYNAIAYIYLITVLLIMKSDIIKNTQELQKVLEEQKKVKEEIERQKQEEKEKQEEANRDKEKEKKKKEKQKDEPEGEPQAEN